MQNSFIFILENAFENVVCEIASIWSRPQWVESVLKVTTIHQHAKCQPIPSMCSPRNVRNRQIRLFHSVKIALQVRKSTTSRDENLISFEGWSGYTNMQDFRQLPSCVLQYARKHRNPKVDPFHQVQMMGQLPSHSFHASSRKCTKTPHLSRFTKWPKFQATALWIEIQWCIAATFRND